MMPNLELPLTVQKALGTEAAQDFAVWLDSQLQITKTIALEVQISPFVARQKVNVLMLEQVSNLLLADEPELLQTAYGRVWRVPVDLTLPKRGRVGRVGEVDVDAHYGQVYYNEQLLTQITEKTDQLIQLR